MTDFKVTSADQRAKTVMDVLGLGPDAVLRAGIATEIHEAVDEQREKLVTWLELGARVQSSMRTCDIILAVAKAIREREDEQPI